MRNGFEPDCAQPDLTLDEVVVVKDAAGIPAVAVPWDASSFVTISALKKACTLPSDIELTSPVRAGAGFGSKVCLILRGLSLSTRPPPRPI